MKKILLFYSLLILTLFVSHKYICLREKCDVLKIKTQTLEATRLSFKNLRIKNKKLQNEFNTYCLPHKQTIALMEGLIDQTTWDEFAHDWCPAPKEIKTRFCNSQNCFYQGHLSFFSFPEEIFSCLQQLLQLPVWPFALSIERKFAFNPILQLSIEYFFASRKKPSQTNS